MSICIASVHQQPLRALKRIEAARVVVEKISKCHEMPAANENALEATDWWHCEVKLTEW